MCDCKDGELTALDRLLGLTRLMKEPDGVGGALMAGEVVEVAGGAAEEGSVG